MKRGVRSLLALAVAPIVLLTGCGQGGFSGLYNTPLPGGADLGEHPYQVRAEFADVLDLVPQAAVKVNDVPVGRVDTVQLTPDNSRAVVTMSVNGDVQLPSNADAMLRQSSLLGEKFVALAAPRGKPANGSLRQDGFIPLSQTNRTPQVEEVLGALSLLLNGGGIGQVHTIVQEMNKALSGNEPQIRATLHTIDSFVSKLDDQKKDITRAIDGMNRLSATLTTQTDNINGALNKLGPGLHELNDQRDQLVGMLQSMNRLSNTAVDTVNRSHDDLVADMRSLAPTLRQLAAAGDKLPKSLSFMMAFPFPDEAMNALKGDYMNADVHIDLDLSGILGNLARSGRPIVSIPGVNDAGQPKMPENSEKKKAGPPLPLPSAAPVPTGPPLPATPQPPAPPKPNDMLPGPLGGLLGGKP